MMKSLSSQKDSNTFSDDLLVLKQKIFIYPKNFINPNEFEK